MTTISQLMTQAKAKISDAKADVTQGTGPNPAMGSRQNDGYGSMTGSVIRNGLIGAGLGAAIALPTGFGVPIGAGVGAAVGVGSALIRHPRVANAVGDGMKAAMAGAAGGALLGVVTPFGPVGGAVAGAAGGLLTGTVSGLLKKYAGGKYSIEGETTVWGRVKKGFMLGAASGGVVGAGAGFLFGGIGALPGAIWGAAIGGVGGAMYGAMSGTVDAATGAKGASFSGGGKVGLPDLHLPGHGSTGQTGQTGQQSPVQQDCKAA
jgi:hypothetical protein